jgi:hypothetical protein
VRCCYFISLYKRETAAHKLYVKITSERISVTRKPLLNEEQNVFSGGRSCMDIIFTIQQCLETHGEYTYNIETLLLFIDFVKAFDSVARKKIMGNNGGK